MNEVKQEPKKWHVGQIAFMCNIHGRYSQEIKEVKISKVGNKYFEIADHNRSKYEIATGRVVSELTDYTTIYKTRQEVLDIMEHRDIVNKLNTYGSFRWTKLPLETLRAISQLINPTQP